MAVSVGWHDDSQTIMVFKLVGKWTWEELEAALKQGQALGGAVPHPLVGVVDVSASSWLPPSSWFLRGRATLKYRPPTALHVTILVGASSLIQSIGNAFNRIYSGKRDIQAVFVPTLAEGIRKANELLVGAAQRTDE